MPTFEDHATPPAQGKNRHILLVEDDPVFAKLEDRVLVSEGYRSSWAPSGEEALDLIRQTPFEYDMVLLDLELGKGISGTRTAEAILSIRTIPIVFVSGHTDSKIFAETALIPSYGFVVKHAGNAVLRNSIAMAFRLWESQQKQGEQDRQFRLIMENLPEILIRVNQEDEILFASPALSRYCQTASLELMGKRLSNLCFSGDFNQELALICGMCFGSRETIQREIMDETGGERTTWEVRATPEWDEASRMSTVLLFIRDITERKESEEFRHLTEARLSFMLDLHNRSNELNDQELLGEALAIMAQLMECKGGAAWYLTDDVDKEVQAEWQFPQAGQELQGKGRQGLFTSLLDGKIGNPGEFRTEQVNPDFLDPAFFGKNSLVFPVLEENRTIMLIVLWGRSTVFSARHREHIGLWSNETARILQKKRIRDALVLRSDHNRAILAASPDGFMLLNEDKQIQDVNDAWLRLFGYRRAEIIGKQVSTLESGMNTNDLSSRTRSVRYKGTDRFEITLKNRDNEILDLEMSVSYSSVGHHYLCLMRDIRVRKDHERKLLRMQSLLEETGRMSKTGAWDFSIDTQHCYWTDEVYHIFEINPGVELTIDHIQPFIDSDDFKKLEKVIKDCMAKETPFDTDFTIHTFAGKGKRVRVQGSFHFKDTKLIRLFGTLQDISRQFEIEADLNLRDAELRQFFEMSEDLLGIADTQTNRFLSLSPGWARSLGYETKELEGTRMTDLIHPDDVENSFRMIARAREGTSSTYTSRYRCKNESYRSIEWRITPGGKRLYIVARDITEQLRHQEERGRQELRNHRLLELYQTNFQDEEHIISLALEEALTLTDSSVAYCHFVHADQKHLDLFAWSKSCDGKCFVPEQRHYPIDQAGLWADPVRTGHGVIHNNYLEQESRRGLPSGHVRFDHHLSVPVMEGEKVMLIAGVGKEGRPYPDEMVMNLELFMSGIWKIIQKHRSDQLAHHKEDEKKDLWKELNHRLKNTTVTILSLLELEEQHSRTDEAKAVLRKSSNRIGSLMRTFQNLYRSNTGLTINLRHYLEETIYQLFQEHMGSRNGEAPIPELKFQCPELMVSLKTAAALGLICGELISNGLRHAFDANTIAPAVAISLNPSSAKTLRLEYLDNGRGFPKGRSPDKNRKFGLELLYLQLSELRGTAQWEIENGCKCTLEVHV